MQADIKGCAIHMTILVLNDELAKKIASVITEFTVLYSVDCIVLSTLICGMKARRQQETKSSDAEKKRNSEHG